MTPCTLDASPPVLGTVDCNIPGLLPICWTGLDVGGGSCVFVNGPCECSALDGEYQGAFSTCPNPACEPISTDETSWGKTKSQYRD